MKIIRNISDIDPDIKPHPVNIINGEDFDDLFLDKNIDTPAPTAPGRLAYHINFRGTDFGTMIYLSEEIDLGNLRKQDEGLITVLLKNASRSIEILREKAA